MTERFIEPHVPDYDDRPMATRGMVVGRAALAVWQQAAGSVNEQQGRQLYRVELHEDQIYFTGQELPEDMVRIVVKGEWISEPYRRLELLWDTKRQIDRREAGGGEGS